MDEKYTKSVLIRIKPTQLEQFQRHSKLAGKSVSEWLRDLGAAAVAAPVEIPFSQCKNPECPVGCLDSHALDFEEAMEKGEYTFPVVEMTREEFKAKYPDGPVLSPEIDAIAEQVAGRAMESLGFKRRDSGVNSKAHEIAAGIPGLMVGFGAPGTGRGLFNPEHPIPLTGYAEKVEARREELKAEGIDVLEQLFPANTPEEPVRSWSEQLPMLLKLSEGDANEELLRLTSGDHPPSKYAQWYRNPKVRPDLIRWLDERYELEAVVEVENPLTDSKGDGW